MPPSDCIPPPPPVSPHFPGFSSFPFFQGVFGDPGTSDSGALEPCRVHIRAAVAVPRARIDPGHDEQQWWPAVVSLWCLWRPSPAPHKNALVRPRRGVVPARFGTIGFGGSSCQLSAKIIFSCDSSCDSVAPDNVCRGILRGALERWQRVRAVGQGIAALVRSSAARSIKNPRVILLDCPLEYKKGENAINVELKDASNFELLLKLEEEYVKGLCEDIAKFKPDVVFTEKGLSDIAAHFLMKAGVTAFRRCRKTDNNRIARATGATIVHRTDELQDCDVGTQCGLMEVRKVGDEYFVFMEECRDPKACTILMRGPSKDALNEMERNLLDAMNVARNLLVAALLPSVPNSGLCPRRRAKHPH